MNAKTTPAFRRLLEQLPQTIQDTSLKQFRLWRSDPFHPSLHFKKIAGNVWSVRVTRDDRALAEVQGDTAIWFWIGSHKDYDTMLRQGRR
ncbi:MAG: hypothetical protein GC162_17705 [Planctomycetes bacterium]|nr:hypothetical protein [Planctomycetota bacterium]